MRAILVGLALMALVAVSALTPGASDALGAGTVAGAVSGGEEQGASGVAGQSAPDGAAKATGSPACAVHSLPSFVAQGESPSAASAGDIVEVECNPYTYGTGSKIKITASQLFSRCSGSLTWYIPNPYGVVKGASGVSVELDPDGNATVALLAGPGCEIGTSQIDAHMEEAPFGTFTTSFVMLAPQSTKPGVSVLPATQVEGGFSSSVAMIVEAEFAGGSEKDARIGAEELYSRCRSAPHLHWIRMDGTEEEGISELKEVGLDNDGNAFVIVIGDASCAEGTSLIEADLESKPFTTYEEEFTIEAPRPTLEEETKEPSETPAFAIEKLQEIAGSGTGFTTSLLMGEVGQTVDYEIVVTNTGNMPLTLSGFSDVHCDEGTIAGGPEGAALAPNASTAYTCDHLLSGPGEYVNDATITGTPPGGAPITHTSNEVAVVSKEVKRNPKEPKPEFTIEKLQEIAGGGAGFTTEPITGSIGQTVDYEIIVKNTGNVQLTFSSFTDEHCDSGTIAGGPGEAALAPEAATTYRCSHVLSGAGEYTNTASDTGTPPKGEGSPLTRTSRTVVVTVAPAKRSAPPLVAAPAEKVGELPFKVCKPQSLVLRGASGPKRGPFAVQVSAAGIRQITFYLDGRKLKTLRPSQAKGGKFTIEIDPRKLSMGAHKVTARTVPSSGACASAARSGVFVHPGRERRTVKFAG